MFARDPDSGLLAVEAVHRVEMREDDITQVAALKCLRRKSAVQFAMELAVDSAKNPWRPVARAADHYSVCTGEIKYLAGFFSVADVAVGKHRNANVPLDVANCGVLGGACKEIRARAAVHGERCDAAALGDRCDFDAVHVLTVPAGADLEGHGNVDRAHDGFENARHQRLVPEQ